MVRRAITVAAVAWALLALLPATPASAHAFLADSNPADGAVLSKAPQTIRLQFSESVVIAATHIDIADSEGRRYPPSGIHLVGAVPGGSTEDPVQVVATLPPLPRSAYRVSWQTLSSDDLHRTSGVLVFGIDEPVHAAGVSEPASRVDESSLRWLVFLGMAIAFGARLTGFLLLRNGASRDADLVRRCLRISAIGAGIGCVFAVALLVDQVIVSGSPVGRLLRSSYGYRWLIREAGLLTLALAAIVKLRTVAPRWLRAGLLVVGAAATSAGSALLGHSGAGRTLQVTRLAADAGHLAAAATWSGALITLVAVVLPRLDSDARGAVLRSFGLYAAACVSVMIVSGVYLASHVVGSVDSALLTFYGRTLLIKIALVAVIAVLGLLNHRRVRDVRRATPRRTVVAEAGVAVVVLGMAAVLAGGQPAREPQYVTSPRPATVPVLDALVGDLQQTLAVRPNRPGRNVVIVEAFDTRRPAPAPIRRVLVSVVGLDGQQSAPAAAERLGGGQWSVAAELPSSGRTAVIVAVQRAGMKDVTHTYRWTVGGGRSATRPAKVSTAPVGSRLRSLAGWLTGLLGMSWLIMLLRRRLGRRGSTPAPAEVPGPTTENDKAAEVPPLPQLAAVGPD